MSDDSVEITFRCFLQEAFVRSSGMGRDVHSLTLSIQLLPLPMAASPILQGGLKDGAGEAVVAPSASLSSMNPMCLKKRGYSRTQETGPCQE